jgi:competence protein ComEC
VPAAQNATQQRPAASNTGRILADNLGVRPLPPLALATAVGIVAGERTALSSGVAALLLAGASIAAALCWRRGKLPRMLAVCLAFAALGALRIALALRPVGPTSIASHTGTAFVRVVGSVLGLPARAEFGTVLQLQVDSAEGAPADGLLRLNILQGDPGVLPGDRIAFRARLRRPRGYRNPGVPDRALPERARGLRAIAGVAGPADVRLLAPGRRDLLRWIAALRARLSLRLDAHLSGDPRAIVGALVLGERALISESVEQAFRRSGTTHLLSVSGVHLAAIALLCYAGVRRLLARLGSLPLRVSVRAVAAAVTIPACAFYALLAGAEVPVVRSTIMASVLLGAVLLDRAGDGPSALAAAALLVLLADPGALFDASFQLSFSACVGLALAPRVGGRGLAVAIANMASATGSASLLTAGLCAFHFGQVSILGVLTNLVAIPYSSFVLLPVALLAVAVPPLLPVAAVLAEILVELARVGADVPLAAVAVATPTVLEIALLGVASVCLLRGRLRLALGAACALVLCVALRHRLADVGDAARVTVLDVGQGDAVLVELPQGRTLLCDGGGGFDGSPLVGDIAVLPALRALGVLRLDVVALSHPHPDHFGGLRAVLRDLEVGEIWTNGDPCRHPACPDLFDLARRRGIPVRRPRPLVAGPARVDPLYPLPAYDADLSTNDNSMVLRVSAHGHHMLLAGDLEGKGEILMSAAAGPTAQADVLKVPHHGSRTSSSDELLDAVRPRLAVISAGEANRFGFPHAEVLDRFRRRGVPLLRTDRNGAVTVRLGPRVEVRAVDP